MMVKTKSRRRRQRVDSDEDVVELESPVFDVIDPEVSVRVGRRRDVQATSSVSTPAVVSPVPSSFAMEELKSIVLSVGDKLSGQVEDVRNDVNKRLEDADDRLTMFHDRLKDVHEDMAAMQQEVHQMEIRSEVS
jgi:hypothetical protein